MKKVLLVLLLITAIIIGNSLVSSIVTLWQKKNLVLEAQKELDVQKQENQKLKAQISYAQTPQFIEEQARNKLLLIKSNEEELMLPAATPSSAVSEEPVFQQNETNWEAWRRLFFGSN